MFQFKVSNLEDADELCNTWATKCVSLLGPEYKDLYKTTPTRLVVYFDDVDFYPKPGSRWIAPHPNQIKEVLEFCKSLDDSDKLLVHCKAGISRSTAMLIGILCLHKVTPAKALTAVRQVRPELWPNKLMIQFCDDILNLNSALIKAVAAFKIKQKHKLFIPFARNEHASPTIRDCITILETEQSPIKE